MAVRRTIVGLVTGVILAVPLVVLTSRGAIPSRADAVRHSAEFRSPPSDISEADALPDLGPAPELRGIETWLNSRPLDLASLRGKVVLLEFWTMSCVNCLDALPHMSAWQKKYGGRGLVVIGVHSPELPAEHAPERVEAAIEHYGINYPVAIDNRLETWTAYHNRYWPSFYFIDARGHVRYAHFGSGDYAANEAVIRRLLAERSTNSPDSPPSGAVLRPVRTRDARPLRRRGRRTSCWPQSPGGPRYARSRGA